MVQLRIINILELQCKVQFTRGTSATAKPLKYILTSRMQNLKLHSVGLHLGKVKAPL